MHKDKINIKFSEVDPGFIPTNEGQMTPEDIIDHLTYSNYAFNRDISPNVTPEQWAKLFGVEQTKAMEHHYQYEINQKTRPLYMKTEDGGWDTIKKQANDVDSDWFDEKEGICIDCGKTKQINNVGLCYDCWQNAFAEDNVPEKHEQKPIEPPINQPKTRHFYGFMNPEGGSFAFANIDVPLQKLYGVNSKEFEYVYKIPPEDGLLSKGFIFLQDSNIQVGMLGNTMTSAQFGRISDYVNAHFSSQSIVVSGLWFNAGTMKLINEKVLYSGPAVDFGRHMGATETPELKFTESPVNYDYVGGRGKKSSGLTFKLVKESSPQMSYPVKAEEEYEYKDVPNVYVETYYVGSYKDCPYKHKILYDGQKHYYPDIVAYGPVQRRSREFTEPTHFLTIEEFLQRFKKFGDRDKSFDADFGESVAEDDEVQNSSNNSVTETGTNFAEDMFKDPDAREMQGIQQEEINRLLDKLNSTQDPAQKEQIKRRLNELSTLSKNRLQALKFSNIHNK